MASHWEFNLSLALTLMVQTNGYPCAVQKNRYIFMTHFFCFCTVFCIEKTARAIENIFIAKVLEAATNRARCDGPFTGALGEKTMNLSNPKVLYVKHEAKNGFHLSVSDHGWDEKRCVWDWK